MTKIGNYLYARSTHGELLAHIGNYLYARSTHGELLAHATNGAFVTTAMWYLLSTRRVDAVLGVEHDRERNLTHTRFIDDPREIVELVGTVVTAPLNIVQTLRKYGGSGRVALPVMPCEEKLLDVLIRKNEPGHPWASPYR